MGHLVDQDVLLGDPGALDVLVAQVALLAETSVLKSTKSTYSDDWPIFELKDAVVYRKSKDGRLVIANVCNVDLEGPFVIRGKLDIDLSDQKEYMRNYSYKSAYIEIPLSHSYSIGYGPWPAVWASGTAGWYEIAPAPEYEAMYETVCEGITLYYKVMDVYQQYDKLSKAKRHKAYQMPIERLLLKVRTPHYHNLAVTWANCAKYAVAVGDGVTLSEAKERCHVHAPFLLAKFEKENDINWNSTSFKKWMTASHPDLVHKLEAAKNKPPPPPADSPEADPVEPEEELHNGALDLPIRISPDTDRSRRSKSRASRQSEDKETPAAPRTETPIHPPVVPPFRPASTATTPSHSTAVQNSSPPAEPQDPVQFLKDLVEEILEEQGGDTSRVTESRVHSQMHAKCRIRAYRAAREITHFYAKPLVASMPSKWYQSPFFQWLKSVRDQPWIPEILTRDEVPGQCIRRTKVGKVIPRTRTLATGNQSPPRGAGKRWPPSNLIPRTGGLRPGTGAKRPATYDEEDTDDERARKAAKTKHALEDEEEEEEDVDEEEANDPSEAAPPMADVATSVATPVPDIPMETVRVVVRAEKIPTMSPSGPNGTWRCEEEGCTYIVRSAEEKEGRDLIAKHFKDHEKRVDKLNLALSEGTRGHMPINHLLEKIRSMGERAQSKEQGQIDGVSVPRPIKRRLIV
ncbi:hypothetical protein VMCG_05651 [Cytospora schulzeri]|uniref:DNA (cytosine-5)-methyltransferase 1 replication foci domain-containing protein n=1 Tax=Cytospora schulzeri TaxID=448051 RepID=A0A423WF65_9PEZI|nr:hypothetical protein VMCG_05651 [Valsa malicola]